MRRFVEPNVAGIPMGPQPKPVYPCGICSKNVGSRKSLTCDICGYWLHIGCEGISAYNYSKMIKLSDKNKLSHVCKICREEIFPFQKLSENEFLTSIIKNIDYNEDLDLNLNPDATLQRLFTDFSNHSEDEPSPVNCEYYDATSRIPSSNEPNHSIFHLNIASLGAHKDELETVLSLLSFEFDIIAVSETKIIKDIDPNYDINLPGYHEPFSIPTESTKGGVMIYCKETITPPKRRPDLEKKLYESRALESVFIELENEGSKNEIVGCIYRHPSMCL